jgi:hypothetical protein
MSARGLPPKLSYPPVGAVIDAGGTPPLATVNWLFE